MCHVAYPINLAECIAKKFIIFPFIFNNKKYCNYCLENLTKRNLIHYRKTYVCRVPKRFPWAKRRAHGKGMVCRVSWEQAHGKGSVHGEDYICRAPGQTAHGESRTHGKTWIFAVCLKEDTRQRWQPVTAFGWLSPLPCASIKHTAKILFAVCFILSTRQRCTKRVELDSENFLV